MTENNEGCFPEECRRGGEIKKVGFQLKVLDHMFCREMEADIRNSGFEGMSAINIWIIDYLMQNEHREVFQKDIEKNFKIGKSSIAGTLKIMEEKGFITRHAVKGDARLKRVCLAERGKECACRLKQGRENMEQRVCRGLSREELDLFFRIVRKMQDNLTK